MNTRAYHYIIDTEGKLWQEGYEFDDPELLSFFFQHMQAKENGSFEVLCQGERCVFHPQDVPYIVQQLEIFQDHIQLVFQGGYEETLDPSTLEIGKENILYCKIREGKIKARFKRNPYWEICKLIDWNEKENLFYLVLNGEKTLISSLKEEAPTPATKPKF